jgi:hypothetical protein
MNGCRAIVTQDHGDGLVWRAGAAPGVDEEQEAASEQMATPPPVEMERQADHTQGEPAW